MWRCDGMSYLTYTLYKILKDKEAEDDEDEI